MLLDRLAPPSSVSTVAPFHAHVPPFVSLEASTRLLLADCLRRPHREWVQSNGRRIPGRVLRVDYRLGYALFAFDSLNHRGEAVTYGVWVLPGYLQLPRRAMLGRVA